MYFSGIIFVFSSIILQVSSTATCEVRDRNDCHYTVVCEYNAGNAFTPDCNHSPYVTFIITKSTADPLYTGFFGSTNFDSRVRVIKGVANNWPTLDSTVFRYYTKTIVMDISNNNIQTIRDDAFKNLLALETLNLSSNAIQAMNARTFHFSESVKSSLKVLDLSNNKISELSGNLFMYISELAELYLYNNRIKSLQDACFESLGRLTHLYLQNNQITGLNESMTPLRSVAKIDLSFNSLTSLHGNETQWLISLEIFNASHNVIKYIQSNCWSQAFNLKTVDLSHNKLQSNIENVMFVTNNKLEYLNLYHNMITQIQDNAFKNNVLTYLNLERNNLTGELSKNLLSGLHRIVSLNLSNQSITAIKSNTFSDAVSLIYLNLSRNNINFIDNTTFEKIYNLQTLDFSYNNISSVDFLNKCLFNLTELYLTNNNLTVLKADTFRNQTYLVKLDLSMNKIVIIEPYSLPLINLQYLNVSENPVTGVITANTYSPAKYIRFLDLCYFNITTIDSLSIVDLPVLARLNISHNNIKFIDPNNFRGVGNMYSLDISYNFLSNFQLNNITLSNIKALYLNNNRLTNITNTLNNMPSLLYLDLSNNFIVELISVPFSGLPNLKVIHLSHNKILAFNNPQTNSMSKLTELDLSYNELTLVNLSYFKDLVVVNLSNNRFTSINSSLFANLDYLQVLDMSNTSILEIAPGTFQNVRILKLLNMSRNLLTNLRYGSFRGLHKTEDLDLSYNNIADIDVDVFHECTELRILTIDYNNLAALDVERLINTLPKLTTLSLGGNPITCKEIVRNMKKFNKNNMLRQVDVTSVHKIYHEDNVHGITCGNRNYTTDTTDQSGNTSQVGAFNQTTSHVLLVWCTILTTAVIVIAAVYFYRQKRRPFYSIRESRVPLGASLDFTLNQSENQNDLLG